MLSSEQKELYDLAFRIGKDLIEPQAARWDAEKAFPWPIHEVASKQDWYGLTFPEEHGGLGRPILEFAILLEAIGASSACGATMGLIETHSLGAQPIVIAGNSDQKSAWLPGIASGESLCAFSITEPETGSDVGSMSARAVRSDQGYVINARKVFCTLGNMARFITVFAKVPGVQRGGGITAFVVDTEQAQGLSVGRIEKKMGLRGNPTVELMFDDVVVPEVHRLGEEGEGFRIAMETLLKGRVAVAADSVGVMQYVLKYAKDYSDTRTQFGKPIGELQGIAFKLADMDIACETARQATYNAARSLDEPTDGRTRARLTAIAKCYATDVRLRVVSDALQILGGYGYMEDHPLERIYRDSRIYPIFEGTNEIQRVVISRALSAL